MVSENWKRIQGAQLHKHRNSRTKPDKSKEPLWFDVKPEDLERSRRERIVDLKPQDLFPECKKPAEEDDVPKKYVAMDCEMVGIGPGGKDSALARISLVDWNGRVLLDSFVRPQVAITDYRTAVSGVSPDHLTDAPRLSEIQRKVTEILDGRILIGHALEHDLRVLMLSHSRIMRRDTSRYGPFRRLARGRTPALRVLSQQVLGLTIQKSAHDSIDDARTAMLLYRHVKKDWENSIFRHEHVKLKEPKVGKGRYGSRPFRGWSHRPKTNK
jgi:RNA exonuclease 4